MQKIIAVAKVWDDIEQKRSGTKEFSYLCFIRLLLLGIVANKTRTCGMFRTYETVPQSHILYFLFLLLLSVLHIWSVLQVLLCIF